MYWQRWSSHRPGCLPLGEPWTFFHAYLAPAFLAPAPLDGNPMPCAVRKHPVCEGTRHRDEKDEVIQLRLDVVDFQAKDRTNRER